MFIARLKKAGSIFVVVSGKYGKASIWFYFLNKEGGNRLPEPVLSDLLTNKASASIK